MEVEVLSTSNLPEASTGRCRGLSKSFISRDIIRATPFRALINLLITYLLSPLPLQVALKGFGPHI